MRSLLVVCGVVGISSQLLEPCAIAINKLSSILRGNEEARICVTSAMPSVPNDTTIEKLYFLLTPEIVNAIGNEPKCGLWYQGYKAEILNFKPICESSIEYINIKPIMGAREYLTMLYEGERDLHGSYTRDPMYSTTPSPSLIKPINTKVIATAQVVPTMTIPPVSTSPVISFVVAIVSIATLWLVVI